MGKTFKRYTPSLNLFDFDRYPPSVDNLDPAITTNSITVYPYVRYNAKHAGSLIWKPWGYGDNLVLEAGTAPSYNQGSPLMGKSDDSVKINGGGYYREKIPSTVGKDLTTEDVIFEIVLGSFNTGKGIVGNEKDGNGGWVIYGATTTSLRLYLDDNGGANNRFINAAVNLGSINHVMYFVRHDRMIAVVNGVWNNTQETAVLPVSLGCLNTFGIGFTANNAAAFTGNMFYFSMWKKGTWFQSDAGGPTAWTTIAAERFYKLTGVYPQQSRGAATPTVCTRASSAYVDKFESIGTRKLYLVGSGWPRVCERQESSTSKRLKGFLSETAATNLALQSETLGTTWTQVALTSISDNSANGPDGSAVLDGLVGDANDTQHGVTQAINLTAVKHTVSCFVRAGNKTWCYLFDSTVANCYSYFDISNKATGTKGAGCDAAFIKDWVGGLVRITITFTGTAAAHTIGIYAAQADTDNDFAGDAATVNIHAGCFQVETMQYASSYVPTTTGQVTRQPDLLKFNSNNLTLDQGTIKCDILMSSCMTIATSESKVFFCVNDGTAANQLDAYIYNNRLYIDCVSPGHTDSGIGTTDLSTGTIKNIKLLYDKSKIMAFIDEALEIAAVTRTASPSVTTINVGCYYSTTAQANFLIGNLKINKEATNKK